MSTALQTVSSAYGGGNDRRRADTGMPNRESEAVDRAEDPMRG